MNQQNKIKVSYPDRIQKSLNDTMRRRAALRWPPPDYESGLQFMFYLMGGWPAWRALHPPDKETEEAAAADEKALTHSVEQILYQVIHHGACSVPEFDKLKEASSYIVDMFIGMIDAVYEGAGQWEERCLKAEAAINSENPSKGSEKR